MRRVARYLPKAGTLISTVCVVLAVPPMEYAALIWVGLVPWFYALRKCETTSEALVQGFWLNLLLGFGGAFWVAHAAERYLSVSSSVGLLILLAHALVHQFHLIVFGAMWWRTLGARPPTTFGALLALAFLYTGLDWITPKLFEDTLGMVLYSSPVLRQLAAFGGAELLTFVVLVANLAIYGLAAEANMVTRWGKDALPRFVLPTLRLALPMIAFFALGAFEKARIDDTLREPERVLRVGIVQGNVSDAVRRRWAKGDPGAAEEALRGYVHGTDRLLDSADAPDLVVWPETAFPGVFRKPESDSQLHLNVAFDRYIADAGVPIAFGACDREKRVDQRVLRNALYLVTPSPEQPEDRLSPMQVYHKSTLFPFGEYVPFVDAATARAWLPTAAHLARGEGPEVLDLPRPGERTLRVGPSICYEDVFASHARALAHLQADLVLNISNDSWFGDDGAARWHLMMATLRSIETRIPQVRATNSGYSAFVLPNGEMREVTEFGEYAERTFTMPLVAARPTLSTHLGDWYGPLSLLLGAAWLVSRRLRRRDARG